MAEIKIIVPSTKRSDIFLTNISNQIICVHESEKEDYKNLPFEIITHDKNTLSEIRQFIFQKFGNVFMVDDDIVSVERLYRREDTFMKPDEIYNLIQETAYTAEQVGAYLFGFNSSFNPKHYKGQKPFVANGYINACAFGLIKNDKLFFHNLTIACESHWINLLNAYYHRFSFQDTRFTFRQKPNSTFQLKGGQTTKRTLESEKRDSMFLRRMFGESIQLKTGSKDSKVIHQYQRKLNIRL